MIKLYRIVALCCVSTLALRLPSEVSQIPVETRTELLDTKPGIDTLRFVPAVKPFVDDQRFPEDVQEDTSPREFNADSATRSDFMPLTGPKGGLQWQDRLLVWPEKKFAFCWIDKNAGTQFNLLFNHLNNITGIADPWWASSAARLHAPWEYFTKANGWRFGIFLRDPAERFLSAWASKCQQMEDHGDNCLGPKNAPAGMPDAISVFQQAASDLPAYMNHVKERGWWNSHYDPQNTFCGARELTEYDFVGHLTGDHEQVHTQIQDMFKRVAQVPREHGSFWSLLEETFPIDSVQGHSTNSSHKLELFYRSPEIYQIVTNAYEDDYSKLNMERGHYEPL